MKVEAVVSGTLGVKPAWLRLGLNHLNLEKHLVEALLTSFLNRGPHLLRLHLPFRDAVIVPPHNESVRKGFAATDKPDLPLRGFIKSALIMKISTGAGGLLFTVRAKFTLKVH